MTKPSDDPRSPFNKNWKSDIDWSSFKTHYKNAQGVSRYVNKKRAEGIEVGTVHGITTNPHVMVNPKKFAVNLTKTKK